MKMSLPGVFWIVLLLALIPAIQTVLEQFFPATEYWYTALIVALLGAIAKAVEVWARKEYPGEIDLPDGAPRPAAAARPAETTAKSSPARRWLMG